MNFGQKILKKYGFKEGSGLGKNSDGIKAPIKVSFKFDQAGLGGKDEATTQNQWWERCFNEASNNLNVDLNSEKIAISLNDKDGVEITNKSYSLKKIKESGTKLKYGNFLKSATLLADVGQEEEIIGHLTTESIEIKPFQTLNDEELFKACDGRTAHKGARHGLNLSGKLQRIADQEKILLERLKKSKESVFKQPETADIIATTKKRPLIELNNSKDDDSSDVDTELPLNLESAHGTNSASERKKLKKSHLKKLNKIASKIDSIELESPTKDTSQMNEEIPLRERRKEKKRQKRELDKIIESSEAEIVEKKRCKTVPDDDERMGDSEKKLKKKKKKNRKQRQNDDDDSALPCSSPEKIPTPKVRNATPILQKKKSKNFVAGIEKISEDRETYKRLLEDDIAMIDSCDPIKPKRIKLNDPYEATGDDESDIVDALNAEHHQNAYFKNKASEVENLNFESSSKKVQKHKKREKFSTDEWEVKNKKKASKIEKEKRKKLKNMERRDEKKEKKHLKKLAKKELAAETETLVNEINSLDFA